MTGNSPTTRSVLKPLHFRRVEIHKVVPYPIQSDFTISTVSTPTESGPLPFVTGRPSPLSAPVTVREITTINRNFFHVTASNRAANS